MSIADVEMRLDALALELGAALAECLAAKKALREAEERRRRAAGELPGPGGIGDLFGVSFWTEGFRITERWWDITGAHARWGDQSIFRVRSRGRN